ncbi:hypothetical protein M3J09_001039 [Ascochyta lentis]
MLQPSERSEGPHRNSRQDAFWGYNSAKRDETLFSRTREVIPFLVERHAD